MLATVARFIVRRINSLVGLLLLSFLLIVAMQNCENLNLSVKPTQAVAVQSSAAAPATLFGTLEPVLATRNPACISCHAQINGDLITDLGLGDPFFMGQDATSNHPQQASYYSPFASKHFIWQGGTWSSASVMGNIYVPDVEISDQRLLAAYEDPHAGNVPLDHNLKVLDFMTGNFIDPTISATTPVQVIPMSKSTDISVPGLRGQVKSRKTIWIDSPGANEIHDLELADGASMVVAKPGTVIFKSAPTDQISGLEPVQSNKTFRLYLSNNGPVTCKGDIIVEGVVFLNNLQLNTDDKGCRLYVSGSVFIQGPITYVNGGNSNLQITSSRAIIMGMRSLNSRLTQLGTTASVGGLRQAWTDDEELNLNLAIINDRDDVNDLTNDAGPFRLMVDPAGQVLAINDDFDTGVWAPAPGRTNFPDPKTCVGGIPTAAQPCGIDWSGNYAAGVNFKKSVDYEHLFLNAPKVYSRYYGVFKGVIIGEDVLFAVSHFRFEKDPVMLQVQLMPLLQNRIFSMSDN